jgi:hypothetical protein
VCIGGGPAGLYLAISAKLRDADHDIIAVERDPGGATYGWGVVYWDDLLDVLFRNDRGEKLKREHGIKLSRIQDVAGARIISGSLRVEQGRAVDKIVKQFDGLQRAPLVIDRGRSLRQDCWCTLQAFFPSSLFSFILIRREVEQGLLWPGAKPPYLTGCRRSGRFALSATGDTAKVLVRFRGSGPTRWPGRSGPDRWSARPTRAAVGR